MDIREESRNGNLKLFIEEYLAKTEPGSRLLGFDFFRLGKAWQFTLLVDSGQQQALLNADGSTLCSYDQLTPLFRLQQAPGAEFLVQDLKDQLLGLRSKASATAFGAAVRSLDTMCCPFDSLSGAYLVRQQDLYGVVNPLGQVLIAPKYRKIAPFSFREVMDSAGIVHGQTGLYLCSGDLHRLNTMDVYDRKGNLIFKEVAGVYPREEALLTPAPVSEPCAPALPGLKQLRSLWVSRQQAVSPFPDAPQLQSVADDNRRFSLRELYRPVPEKPDSWRIGAVDPAPDWEKDPWNAQALKGIESGDPVLRELLKPMAQVLGELTGYEPEELLERLKDYGNFCRERRSSQVPLDRVTADTEISRMMLTVQCYNCLVRNGLRTAGEVAALSDERIARLQRLLPKTLPEITSLRNQLKKHLECT